MMWIDANPRKPMRVRRRKALRMSSDWREAKTMAHTTIGGRGVVARLRGRRKGGAR